MDIDDVGARAARAAIMTKSKAMENRDEIRRQAREELLRNRMQTYKKPLFHKVWVKSKFSSGVKKY
jgi:hypothetical protein